MTPPRTPSDDSRTVYTICAVPWVVEQDDGATVTVRPLDAHGSLTGKPVMLSCGEWAGAIRHATITRGAQ